MAAIFESDSSSSSSDESSEDEMLFQIAIRARRVKNIRPRADHFNLWNEEEFFMRFGLTKLTVLHLLQEVKHRLETPTDVFILYEQIKTKAKHTAD